MTRTATYQGRHLEARKGEDGKYYAWIDGEQSDVKASPYKRVVIKRAIETYREQFLKEAVNS